MPIPPISDNIREELETMLHMAASDIRALLRLLQSNESVQPSEDLKDLRESTIYLAEFWLERYRELDSKLENKNGNT